MGGGIYLVGSGQCIVGRKRDDFTDESDTSYLGKGMGKSVLL